MNLISLYAIIHKGDIVFSVIFDMDGTLFDTQRICIPAWDWAGERQGFKNVGKHIPVICGMSDVGWQKHLKDNFPEMDVQKFSSEAREYVVKNLVVKYMPGAEELVKFFREKGVKLAIASGSSQGSIKHHLAEVGGTQYFDAIVGGADVKNGKPAPDIFLLAAEKLGAEPKDCYVLEDSPNGIRAGHAAGMRVIGIPDIAQLSDELKALETAEFKSMYEVLDFFKQTVII